MAACSGARAASYAANTPPTLVAGVIGVLASHNSQPKDENKQETWARIPENACRFRSCNPTASYMLLGARHRPLHHVVITAGCAADAILCQVPGRPGSIFHLVCWSVSLAMCTGACTYQAAEPCHAHMPGSQACTIWCLQFPCRVPCQMQEQLADFFPKPRTSMRSDLRRENHLLLPTIIVYGIDKTADRTHWAMTWHMYPSAVKRRQGSTGTVTIQLANSSVILPFSTDISLTTPSPTCRDTYLSAHLSPRTKC